MTELAPLELRFTVGCPPERARSRCGRSGRRCGGRTATRCRGAPGLTVTFEPREGGRIYERTPDGAEHDWGEVLAWEPPRRLVYLWHLRFDRTDATEVEIRFETAAEGTRVSITHSGWERLGARAAERRERNERGWAGLLPHYVAACQPA